MTTIAFLGTGAMGSRMAARLIGAGHRLTVWNRTSAKAEPLRSLGASVAATPALAVVGAEVVITMLADPAALTAVSEGTDGLAAGLRTPALTPESAARRPVVVVEMSTVGPSAITALRRSLPDHVALVDAPVLGSLSEVDNGTLQVFAGGEPEIVESLLPLLSAFGAVHHVGPLGAGASAKLVANSTLVGVLSLLGEAVALGDALGLDRSITTAVLGHTVLGAQTQRRAGVIAGIEPPVRFELALAVKDADLVVAAGHDSGIELRLAAQARSWFADAAAAGLADHDYSTVISHIAPLGPPG